MTFRKTQLV